jgi:hypothetical protein
LIYKQFRALQQLRASYKKTFKAAEQHRLDVVAARETWVRLAEITETMRFIFIDEAAKNDYDPAVLKGL